MDSPRGLENRPITQKLRLSWLCTKLARTALTLCLVPTLIGLFNGAVVSRYRVDICDADRIITAYTSESDPNAVLEEYKVPLATSDDFNFSGLSENGEATITVERAKKVTIEADKTIKTDMMLECTVAEALEELNVTVGDNDYINVAKSESIVDGMTITINRVKYEDIIEHADIPYDVKETRTPTLSDNNRKTLKVGKDGVMEIAIKRKLVDGVAVSEDVLSQTVIQKPVMAEVLVGDSDAAVSRLVAAQDIQLDANGNPTSYQQKITGKATAYSSLGRYTKLKPGNVAMDLSQFPIGTQLYIKTVDGEFIYGYSVVKDTGHALVNGDVMVDLFFNSYRESCLFGARIVDIYVL